MRSVVTDGVVARFVCLSVGHVCEPCENGWTDQDAVWATRVGLRNHVLDGVDNLHRKGQVLGVVRPIKKHWESLLRCTQQNGSFHHQELHTVHCPMLHLHAMRPFVKILPPLFAFWHCCLDKDKKRRSSLTWIPKINQNWLSLFHEPRSRFSEFV